jgi:Protein of unknown function (DUF3570)
MQLSVRLPIARIAIAALASEAFASAPARAADAKTAAIDYAIYDDSDNVTVSTPSVRLGWDDTNGWGVHASYLVDIVSAASVDVVSTASNRFRDVRQAGTLSGEYKPKDFGIAIGGAVSSELDYLSFGGYAKLIKDFDEKNWTLTLGYGYSHDIAGRCGGGGVCTPFSVFSRPLDRSAFDAGVAWVVDRRSLASLAVDVVLENGDQSKPYRYVPMFSPDIAPQIPRGASIAVVNANRLPERPLEQLPLTRQRGALVFTYAHRFDGSTLRAGERLYDDSWGLFASSTDASWIFDVGRRFDVGPRLRFHVQSAVSFWQRAYVSSGAPGWNLPEIRTGDRELGPLWTGEGGAIAHWYFGSEAAPRGWSLGFTGDVMYTSFLDDLYVTQRTSVLGVLTLEAQW